MHTRVKSERNSGLASPALGRSARAPPGCPEPPPRGGGQPEPVARWRVHLGPHPRGGGPGQPSPCVGGLGRPPQLVGGTVRAAIRRPSSSSSSSGVESELRKRNYNNKSKDKFEFEFDETKAQIFRLKLDEAHLQTRLFFNDYKWSFIYSSLALSSLLLNRLLLNGVEKDGILRDVSPLVPLVFLFISLCKVIVSLGKVSFEKSASRKSENQLSLVVGFLGFGIGILVCSGVVSSVLDFNFGHFDGVLVTLLVASSMGFLAGAMYVPSGKIARSFWLGTDQLRSNLEMVSCGWFARLVLYANLLLEFFTLLLWINPITGIFIKHSNGSRTDADRLIGNVGFSELDFAKLRLWCLLITGLLQVMALRPNLQMYLNEALLSWYQRLHNSKIPDLDFSRAKVFLHNYYLCLAVLQFFAPPILVLLFLGLSQIDGNSFKKLQLLCHLLSYATYLQEVTLLMAWWVILVWATFTMVQLFLYGSGFLYIS